MLHNTDNTDNGSPYNYKTQWHMAIAPAMRLELVDYSGILEYDTEHVLNTKALQVDLLIIRKEMDTVINNDIGRMFRRYNIIEYKSPHDTEGIDEYLKTHAYASLYKLNEGGSASHNLDDITITMIREGKPVKLFKWFETCGCTIREEYKGIYHIADAGFFRTQVIVAKMLDEKVHIWLRALTDRMDREQARNLLNESKNLLDRPEAVYVESVLQIASKANRKLFNELKKEDKNMYSALVELMQPEIDEAVNKAVSEAVQKTKKETWNEASAQKAVEAINNAMMKLGMSKEKACAFMDTTPEQYDEYKLLIQSFDLKDKNGNV